MCFYFFDKTFFDVKGSEARASFHIKRKFKFDLILNTILIFHILTMDKNSDDTHLAEFRKTTTRLLMQCKLSYSASQDRRHIYINPRCSKAEQYFMILHWMDPLNFDVFLNSMQYTSSSGRQILRNVVMTETPMDVSQYIDPKYLEELEKINVNINEFHQI